MFYRPHARVITETGDISMTKQSHKDECDINRILSQYKKTGIITHINNNQHMYTDLPSDVDYQSSLNTILSAQDSFGICFCSLIFDVAGATLHPNQTVCFSSIGWRRLFPDHRRLHYRTRARPAGWKVRHILHGRGPVDTERNRHCTGSAAAQYGRALQLGVSDRYCPLTSFHFSPPPPP